MLGDGNEVLSRVFGWTSIACWLVVYTPQIIENHRLKSGEGLSVFFVVIWLIGDICNLVGAILAHLLPTIIILALYYTACDSILLIQIYYYRWEKATSSATPFLVEEDNNTLPPNPSEEAPLLGGNERDSEAEHGLSASNEFAKYAGALVFVFASGITAWAVDEFIHKGQARSKPQEEVVEWRSQALGWFSAVMYLGARIPQISACISSYTATLNERPEPVKNFRTRCEGLSPFLFVYSITGNITYVLSILAASMSLKHLTANASWIAGSALTVFLDSFVLCQFFWYRVRTSGSIEE
ncbi:hypothetical protein POSPLADRAFT_1059039 [Postia placenta MAD-698-R-SB12]|uniref:PQ-loop-domain-containing protein n=1 Tax=Postia placenta MAD-698-R-SB12 TaxID=670580 RepID=A0A1X6MTM5_9APHY|nr:hypothetical protein POSPLADRAFT_1059039 [Postia placenta MAD-698-R-SB12]OSX59734.1 hypothetical protein POSPLADRAFT_1059039 [Postia placenta MAD-698-R-SB12]